MAKENVKKFFEEVSKNEDLQKKLKAATEKPSADVQKAFEAQSAAVVEVAKKAGFDFTADEFIEAGVVGDKKLDQNELDAVAGGWCAVLGLTKDKKFACFFTGAQQGSGTGCVIAGVDK